MSGAAPGPAPPTASPLRAGATAIVDQFLFVGASSLLVLLLGRALPAIEYGGFVLAYSTFLLLGQAQTALFAEPMSVFGPSRFAAHPGAYPRAVERLNLFAALLAAAGLLATAGALAAFGQRPAAWAFLGAGLAAPATLALWLRRRTLYLQGRIGRSAVASAAFLVAGVAALWALGRAGVLGAFTGMAALGIASIVGLLASPRARGDAGPAPAGLARAHWEYGRWALLTALLGWSGNLYYFLLPIWHGLESAASLRALMNFVYPVLQANQALTLLVLPRWSAHASRAGFARSLARLAWGWTFATLALCAGALLAGPEVVRLVYAGRYDAVAPLLPWVFLLVLPDGLCYLLANGLRASRAPERVAAGALALPVVVLLPGVPLMVRWAAAGAVTAMLLASVAQLAIVWRGWRRPEGGQRSATGD